MQRSRAGMRGRKSQENPFADNSAEVLGGGNHDEEERHLPQGSYPDDDLYPTVSTQDGSYLSELGLSNKDLHEKYYSPFSDNQEVPESHLNPGRGHREMAGGDIASISSNYYERHDNDNMNSGIYDNQAHDGLDDPLVSRRFSALPPLPHVADKELPLPPIPNPEDLEKARAGGNAQERRKKQLMRMPWFVYFVSMVQFCVLIAELVKMGILTGNPFQTQPSFNPMLGPSSYVMINMGARFTQCMRATTYTGDTTLAWPCPNSTNTNTNLCSLTELCGFGLDSSNPSQRWRFITPIFLHAGIIHLVVNLLIQVRAGGEIERRIGHIRFFVLYWLSGIGGFLLSGNYAGQLVASVGASGCVFGIIAFDLLDLLYNWPVHRTPWMLLAMHIVEIVVSLVLGLLPGIDNFAHIGGLLVGLLLGVIVLRSPIWLRLREAKQPGHPLAKVKRAQFKDGFIAETLEINYKDLGQHFTGRHWSWWSWWIARTAALAVLIVYFALLARTFNQGDNNCSWCKYLSCLPVNNWCSSTVLGS